MAVKIRLARAGGKKKPFYRIVVTDSQSPRDGKFIEVLGTYNPNTDPVSVSLNDEKISFWLGKGAAVTGTVKQILKKSKAQTAIKAA